MTKFIKIYCLSFFISIMVIPIATSIYFCKLNDWFTEDFIRGALYPILLLYNVYLPTVNLAILICVALPLYRFFIKVEYWQTIIIFVYTQIVMAISYVLVFFWKDYLNDTEASLLGLSFITLSLIQGFMFGAAFKWLYIDFYGEKNTIY